jgi:transposase
MMGQQNTHPVLFNYNVNLEKRIRKDHPLRKVKEAVDFSFVRDEVADCYGYNGNVSVDPEVIMKMMFLLFFDDIPSERELMCIIPERLDYLWFLDYGLDDPIPDHSVLSKARARWGTKVFERLFIRTVVQCVMAGLVDGKKVHFDASLIDANANMKSVIQGSPELIAALKQLYHKEEKKLDTAGAIGDTKNPGRRKGGYKPINLRLMSRTDPDAVVVRKGRGGARLRYKNHRAIDDAYGVTTAIVTTPGDEKDNGPMMDLIDQHECHTRLSVETAVADAQYGTTENFRACHHRGIKSHMADLASKGEGRGHQGGIFRGREFEYDERTDTYRCPAGQTLSQRRYIKKLRAYEYSAETKVCQACSLRSQCTRSSRGRTIIRNEDYEVIEAARAYSHSRAAKRDRCRRMYLVEGIFADATNNHHFKRSRWRGLMWQRIQDWLIAAIQNIRILLRHGWKRAHGVMAQRQPSLVLNSAFL